MPREGTTETNNGLSIDQFDEAQINKIALRQVQRDVDHFWIDLLSFLLKAHAESPGIIIRPFRPDPDDDVHVVLLDFDHGRLPVVLRK